MPPRAASAAVDPAPRKAGVRPAKREAITRAAREVFARDGYARTSIDAIAAAAGVSTRTIYNHYESKEQLFAALLHESATKVADTFVEDVEARLAGQDPKEDLIALGELFASQATRFPEHFAMVDQIRAEAAHFPPAIISAWIAAGPRRVQRELQRRLSALAAAGLIRIDDPTVAAQHFSALVTATVTQRAGATTRLRPKQIRDRVAAAVEVYLHGYAATGPSRSR